MLYYWGGGVITLIVQKRLPLLMFIVLSLVTGIMSGVSLTYICSVLVSYFVSGNSVLFGVALFSVFVIGLRIYLTKKSRTYTHFILHPSEWLIGISATVPSLYIMLKTFREAADGGFLLARNVIFDIAHLVPIVRSFSAAENIPYMSPFVADTDHIYHFLFPFLAGIGESIGVSLVTAISVPSVLGFSLMLLLMYIYVVYQWKFPRLYGGIAILTGLFQSSLTSIFLIPEVFKEGNFVTRLWSWPDYPFKGPYDDSIISIFTTLNVFVNQRHISFVLGFALVVLLVLPLIRSKNSVVLFGIVLGVLFPWHISLMPLLYSIFLVGLVLRKKYLLSVYGTVGIFIGIAPFMTYWINTLSSALNQQALIGSAIQESVGNRGISFLLQFLLQNIGGLAVFVVTGVLSLRKRDPLLLLLFFAGGLFFFQLYRGFLDQKHWSIVLLTCKLFAVAGMYMFSDKRVIRAGLLGVFFLLLSSGIFDFLVIKNDFMLTLEDRRNSALMQFTASTSKQSIFLGQQEMFDPIAFSGRRLYFGFFRQGVLNPAVERQRSEQVRRLFAATSQAEIQTNLDISIDYLFIPTDQKRDRPYIVTPEIFLQSYPVVYEGPEGKVLSVKKTSL